MKKRLNKKGFTMAELLIVVAIIAVLVAIAIPVFTAQLEKSRDAATVANLRSAYAQASAAYINGASENNVTVNTTAKTAKVTGVTIESSDTTYQGEDQLPFTLSGQCAAATQKSVTFTFEDDGTVSAAIGD